MSDITFNINATRLQGAQRLGRQDSKITTYSNHARQYIRADNPLHSSPCSIFPVRFAFGRKLSHSSQRTNGNPWGHTRDEELIRKYWRRWPQAGIGLPTGAVNGVFALDYDTAEGNHTDGRASMAQLEWEHGPLDTHCATSPTGSIHFYFLMPEGLHIPTRAMMPGIDVKGDGGFIILPPTMRPDKGPYQWIDNKPISAAPDWLVALVTAEKPHAQEVYDPEWVDLCEQYEGVGISYDPDDQVRPQSPEDIKLKIEVALSVIPSDDYHLWLRIGAAIADGLGDSGFAVFDDWSSDSSNYEEKACKVKWTECCRMRRIGVETIFWQADQFDSGWRDFYWEQVQR